MDQETGNHIREFVNQAFALSVRPNTTREEVQARLAARINDMIQQDFSGLLALLYRVDVHEGRLRRLLEENSGEHASEIIAGLILERQLEKIKTREKFRQAREDDTEEKW